MDLNLLVALDALLEDNSVQAAAQRLRLTPPAMSRTLSRIRRATGDDILVRTGRTMTPTPYALQLREETRDVVTRARLLLTPARELDLTTLSRVFTVRGHDALLGALAPALVTAIHRQAPAAALRLQGETSGENTDLARRQVDLEVGSTQPSLPEIAHLTAGHDRLVAAFRAGHPLAGKALNAEEFAAAMHVTVSRRGRLHDAADEQLAALGLHRRVVAALPTTAAALALTARTDAVTVVTERLCQPSTTALGLRTAPLPFPTPPIPAVVAWHHRYDSDPAHAWLRGLILDALATLLANRAAAPGPGIPAATKHRPEAREPRP